MKGEKMKAIVCTKYGNPDVLEVQEIKKPTPKNNEVLVKIYASSITAADTMMRKGTPKYGRLVLGLNKPKNPVIGTGFSGILEAIGKEVSSFKVGDQVFGEVIFSLGTNAEYTCVPEDGVIAIKPKNISFEEAAPICDGALTSINFLKNIGNIKTGQKVLINGASGSLGTAAVQLAKHFGAVVTGVCSSKNVALVKSLGADFVIDYLAEDFTLNGRKYDVIYDTVGTLSFDECKESLTQSGAYISPVLSVGLLGQMIWTSLFKGKKAKFSATGFLPVLELKNLLSEIRELLVTNKLKSIIDKSYNLEEIIDAHRYVDSGRKRGNVVLIPH
jgi:NADPH:quinone reductase-like Zn-dependent oxidoreductase